MFGKKIKIASILLLSILASSLSAATYSSAVPMRAGPVSLYGALGTNGNKIVSIANPTKQVMLRGMSFFWSDDTGLPYYTGDVVEYAAKTLKVDVLRFAMAIEYYNSQGQASEPIIKSYTTDAATMKAALDEMVVAAIENDIYLIVDWHSHRAESEQALAREFFSYAAQRYANVPNIIWEVYNEPVNTGWSTIKSYAESIIGKIREHSPNLALVGTSSWAQNPQEANGSTVNQPNVAYVFHFYAGSHSVGSYGGRVTQALNAGNAVFISEWGTTDANGSGSVSSGESQNWITFMESNKISNCNWSVRHAANDDGSNEASALFTGSTILNNKTALQTASFSTSGSIAKNYLVGKGGSWEDSLTAGHTSGACHFNPVTVEETQSTVTGKASSSCTYTSSNENVATISGGTITVKKAGFVIFTGNDGTKSVFTATKVPGQSFFIEAFVCRLNKTCSGTNALNSYSSTGNNNEQKSNTTTQEGTAVTITSSNPEVVSVTKTKCTGSGCIASMQGKDIWAFQFKSLGSSEVRVTAPATSIYSALDTLVTMTYRKNMQRVSSVFKNATVALGSTTDMLPDTTQYERAPVTYTFSNEGYATISGTNLVAGTTDVKINITANSPETDNYEALGTDNSGVVKGITKTITIGTGALDMTTPLAINISNILTPFKLGATPEGIRLSLQSSGLVSIQFLDLAGREISNRLSQKMTAGDHWVSLNHLKSGAYLIRVKQGFNSKTISFIKN